MQKCFVVLTFFASFVFSGVVSAQNLEALDEESGRASFKAAQIPVNIDDLAEHYRKFTGRKMSLASFQKKILEVQESRIWSLGAVSYLKDLYKKERSAFPEFHLNYCKIVFLFKEEFSNDYADSLEQCTFEKTELASGEHWGELKVDGYVFRNEDFKRREWINTPYLIQTISAEGEIRSLAATPGELNAGKSTADLSLRGGGPLDSRASAGGVAAMEEVMMRDPPPEKKSFYQENKKWIWIGAALSAGFLIHQGYQVEMSY